MKHWWLCLALCGCTTAMRRARWYWDDAVPPSAVKPAGGDGRLYGVDLSRYRSIVFVVDVSGEMCGAAGSTSNPIPFFQMAGQAFEIDRIGRVLADAIAALPPETHFWLMVATGGSHLLLTPHGRGGAESFAGRRRAMALARELMCHGDHTGRLTFTLRRAFDLDPEVVVLLSSTLGGDDPELREDAVKHLPEQRAVWSDPVAALARWPHVVPVIAISLSENYGDLTQDDADLKRLAQATGGQYVPPRR